MKVLIQNSVSSPEIRKIFSKAVKEGMRSLSESEDWQIKIEEPEDGAEYTVEISGPRGFSWCRCFFGPTEVNQNFIRDRVSLAVASEVPVG